MCLLIHWLFFFHSLYIFLSSDSSEAVTHSDDAFAPVHYMHFNNMHLEDKDIVSYLLLDQPLSWIDTYILKASVFGRSLDLMPLQYFCICWLLHNCQNKLAITCRFAGWGLDFLQATVYICHRICGCTSGCVFWYKPIFGYKGWTSDMSSYRSHIPTSEEKYIILWYILLKIINCCINFNKQLKILWSWLSYIDNSLMVGQRCSITRSRLHLPENTMSTFIWPACFCTLTGNISIFCRL